MSTDFSHFPLNWGYSRCLCSKSFAVPSSVILFCVTFMSYLLISNNVRELICINLLSVPLAFPNDSENSICPVLIFINT